MLNFLRYFEDKQIQPRPVQIDALNWLSENWNKSQTFALSISVGGGKSNIAAAIANSFPRCRIITNQNILVNQYYSSFPNEISKFYGLANYRNKESYDIDKNNALCLNKPIVTNSIAQLLLSDYTDYEHPDVMIIDEADSSIKLLDLYFTKTYPITHREYYSGNLKTIIGVIDWLKKRAEEKFKLAEQTSNFKKYATLQSSAENLKFVAKALEKYPEYIGISTEMKKVSEKFSKPFLTVKAVETPPNIISNFLGYSGKIIFMSGTLFPHEINSLSPNRKALFFEGESPIPLNRRQVLCAPFKSQLSYPRDAVGIAKELDMLLLKYETLRPALIHCTYSQAAELSKNMKTPHFVYTDKIDKEKVLKEWLESKEKKVLLGPGLSIGVDLKHDLCRLNILPFMKFPNLQDDLVSKRKALYQGDLWYATETIRDFVQATGRSTRDPTDWSLTVMCDNRFLRFFNDYHQILPKNFKDSLVFSNDLLDTSLFIC